MKSSKKEDFMIIYTMGFTKKSAEDFFGIISDNNIEILVDVRLNNQSQLAGFSKGRDLKFFLEKICGCGYSHEELFAPTKEILNGYKKKTISWDEYEYEYGELISQRKVETTFEDKYNFYNNVLLLCSEPTPENCHRRLLAEYLKNEFGHSIKHL